MSTTETFVVRAKPISDAVVRLISDPLVCGLRDRGCHAAVISPEAYAASDIIPDVVAFHYDDQLALDAIRSRPLPEMTACLGADIYNFEIYMRSHDVVDVYFAPTEAHCSLLRSQLMKPVCLLPEAVDMTLSPENRGPQSGKSVCWFGYPESFGKAMASLMPVIEHCLHTGVIDRFALITDASLFPEHADLEILPYAVETFGSIMSQFDYAILSHFALDMHVNSLIKSPNKLLTALRLGVIPIVTATPSYADILQNYGLDCFLFDSPMALLDKLRNLDAVRDAERIERSQIRTSIVHDFSPARTSEAFVAGLSKVAALDATPTISPRQWRCVVAEKHTLRSGLIRVLRDRGSKLAVDWMRRCSKPV